MKKSISLYLLALCGLGIASGDLQAAAARTVPMYWQDLHKALASGDLYTVQNIVPAIFKPHFKSDRIDRDQRTIIQKAQSYAQANPGSRAHQLVLAYIQKTAGIKSAAPVMQPQQPVYHAQPVPAYMKLQDPWKRYEDAIGYFTYDTPERLGDYIKYHKLDVKAEVPSWGESLFDKIAAKALEEQNRGLVGGWYDLARSITQPEPLGRAQAQQEDIKEAAASPQQLYPTVRGPLEIQSPVLVAPKVPESRLIEANRLMRMFFNVLEECNNVGTLRNIRKIMEKEQDVLDGKIQDKRVMISLLKALHDGDFNRALHIAKESYGGSSKWATVFGGKDFTFNTVKINTPDGVKEREGFEGPTYQATLKRIVDSNSGYFLDQFPTKSLAEEAVRYTEECKAMKEYEVGGSSY